ncbi:sporulation protein [Marinicrinis lubricantis]|uniref:Sporulation protein n=1 Tax=Marinicrinis lubricantis TaxID=2086470 RepID=A0ABW1IT10_9BACL
MSFVNKLLASVGIGNATVDTRIHRDKLVPGENVEGVVHIRGGNVEQNIDGIYLKLYTTYIREMNDNKITASAEIGRYQLTQSFVIQANEVKEIPFSFQLPYDTPITVGRTRVWVQTGLDIKSAVDPSDLDYIDVEPAPVVKALLQSISELGFRLRNADCEEAKGRYRNRLPFIQEFEFLPTSGSFRQRLDELEVVFLPDAQGAKVVLEVDRRARGFSGFLSEALDMDETIVTFHLTENDIPQCTQILQSQIARYS